MAGIVVGIDGSPNAQPALDWAVGEATIRSVPLTVITVNEVLASYMTGQPVTHPTDDERLAKLRQAAENAMTDAITRVGPDGPLSASVQAVSGFSAQVLIDASTNAELLVVGTRGGGGFPHLSIGAVASKVLHHAHCPVVLVPHDK